jgi:hypothetical protein
LKEFVSDKIDHELFGRMRHDELQVNADTPQRQRHFRSSLISKKQVEGVIRSRGKWKSRRQTMSDTMSKILKEQQNDRAGRNIAREIRTDSGFRG